MHSTVPGAFAFLNMTLPLIVDLYESKYRQLDKEQAFPVNPHDFNLPLVETFDFIIVGAGTAGCVMARRLSENFQVLLLEAGGEPPPPVNIPALAHLIKYVPSINWMYSSVKQNSSSLDTNGRIRGSGGKMMGGSGSHNQCQYERGNPMDFDHWANMTGDDSWRFRNVLKYFFRFENYQGKFPMWGTSGKQFHEKGGLMEVISSNLTFDEDIWYEAGKELGYRTNVDSNGPHQEGFGPADYNRRKGRRVSTYTEYVKPIENISRNLTVRRYAVVSQIMFEHKRAVGVHYEHHGIPKMAFVSKEVILSAGAYISPIILIRSGVGPREQVESINVPLVADLPVGESMHDHTIVKMPDILVEDKSIFIFPRKNVSQYEFNKYVETGEGFLSSHFSLQDAFIPSLRAVKREKHPRWPDIQLYFGHSLDTNEDVLNCHVNINRPYSRGRITVNATNTEGCLESKLIPVIDYNYFSDESDYDVVMEGMEVCRRVVEETEVFKKIGARFEWSSVPSECGSITSKTYQEYWKCYIRYRSTTNNHVTSTNRMGRDDDPQAVVDSKLRVRGLTGLRVVDASIIPAVPNANINAPIIMIAEKASQEVTEAWS